MIYLILIAVFSIIAICAYKVRVKKGKKDNNPPINGGGNSPINPNENYK